MMNAVACRDWWNLSTDTHSQLHTKQIFKHIFIAQFCFKLRAGFRSFSSIETNVYFDDVPDNGPNPAPPQILCSRNITESYTGIFYGSFSFDTNFKVFIFTQANIVKLQLIETRVLYIAHY